MTYTHFLTYLLAYKKFYEDISELHSLGFDFLEGKFKLTHPIDIMVSTIYKSHYGDEGWEWVEWFIYEKNYGLNPEIKAWDKDGNEVCYSYESLYEYLQSNHQNNELSK